MPSVWETESRNALRALKRNYRSLPVRTQFAMGVILGITQIRSLLGRTFALVRFVAVSYVVLEILNMLERIDFDEQNGILTICDERIPHGEGEFYSILQRGLDVLDRIRLAIRVRFNPRYIGEWLNQFLEKEPYFSVGMLVGSFLGLVLG